MSETSSTQLRYAVRLQTGALMVALISAGAFISVPIPGSPVPIVLQNMFVILTGVLLPAGWAALSVGVYLILGAVGLPVFAGATGGLAHLAGPTGGFLIGFPISAAVVAVILQDRRGARDGDQLSTPRGEGSQQAAPHRDGQHQAGMASIAPASHGVVRHAIALVAGFLVIYATGVPWLALTAGLSPAQALVAGMLPFLPGDIMKTAVLLILIRSIPRSLWQMLN